MSFHSRVHERHAPERARAEGRSSGRGSLNVRPAVRSGPVVRPKVDGRGIHATATLLNSPKNSSAERGQPVVAHAGSKSTSTTFEPCAPLVTDAGAATGSSGA